LHNLTSYTNKAKEDGIGETCSTHGETWNEYKTSAEIQKGRDHSGDLSLNGRTVQKRNLIEQSVKVWMVSSGELL